MVKLNSKNGTTNNPGKNRTRQEDTKSTRHITYTPNPIPTPYIQQRKKQRKSTRKKENTNPRRNKRHAPFLHHQQRELILAQRNRTTRKGNNQTEKVIPAKIQTHLNKLEPREYIKNAARAHGARLYPIKRRNLQ
jgi:hypothetical protein